MIKHSPLIMIFVLLILAILAIGSEKSNIILVSCTIKSGKECIVPCPVHLSGSLLVFDCSKINGKPAPDAA